MCNFNRRRNACKAANVLLLFLSSLVTHKLLAIQHIDIATEQSFRYMKLTDAKIRMSKNMLGFANRVTYDVFQKLVTTVFYVHVTLILIDSNTV